MTPNITFQDFHDQWMADITSEHPNEFGFRFATKLFSQWRDLGESSDEITYGSGIKDNEIDLAFLETLEPEGPDDTPAGRTLYLVQSKAGRAADILFSEGTRTIDSILSQPIESPSNRRTIRQTIDQFMMDSSASDRLILVLATEYPVLPTDKSAIDKLRSYGQSRIGPKFDLVAISLETIYLNTLDDSDAADVSKIRVNMVGTWASSGDNLLIGSVPLINLYSFLKSYRAVTEDLDQLYEKNVRRFLGGRRAVNKAMMNTLLTSPSAFGLYNNGITIVVRDFHSDDDTTFTLVEPYVVNGCQTTKTIWEVFRQRLDAGISPSDVTTVEWEKQATEGVVVTKVVRVGSGDERLLQDITRFTNSQNAVSQKDFVTLEEGFQVWKRVIAEKYGIFLEVQRGGWDSQQAFQSHNPTARAFVEYANAFDMLKVYGAGWLKEAGSAFGRNAAFAPGGYIYKRIVAAPETDFGVDDIYACFRLNKAATQLGFGRGARKISRRQSRYLFFLVTIDLLKDVLVRSNYATDLPSITRGMIRLLDREHEGALSELLSTATAVIDEYISEGDPDSVFAEPQFLERFNNNINGFLKWDGLNNADNVPNLTSLLAVHKRTIGRGNPSPRDIIAAAIGPGTRG